MTQQERMKSPLCRSSWRKYSTGVGAPAAGQSPLLCSDGCPSSTKTSPWCAAPSLSCFLPAAAAAVLLISLCVVCRAHCSRCSTVPVANGLPHVRRPCSLALHLHLLHLQHCCCCCRSCHARAELHGEPTRSPPYIPFLSFHALADAIGFMLLTSPEPNIRSERWLCNCIAPRRLSCWLALLVFRRTTRRVCAIVRR